MRTGRNPIILVLFLALSLCNGSVLASGKEFTEYQSCLLTLHKQLAQSRLSFWNDFYIIKYPGDEKYKRLSDLSSKLMSLKEKIIAYAVEEYIRSNPDASPDLVLKPVPMVEPTMWLTEEEFLKLENSNHELKQANEEYLRNYEQIPVVQLEFANDMELKSFLKETAADAVAKMSEDKRIEKKYHEILNNCGSKSK